MMDGIGKHFVDAIITLLVIAIIVGALSVSIANWVVGAREKPVGSQRMYGVCVSACEDRGGVKEWDFRMATCGCHDWSLWYVDVRIQRVTPQGDRRRAGDGR